MAALVADDQAYAKAQAASRWPLFVRLSLRCLGLDLNPVLVGAIQLVLDVMGVVCTVPGGTFDSYQKQICSLGESAWHNTSCSFVIGV